MLSQRRRSAGTAALRELWIAPALAVCALTITPQPSSAANLLYLSWDQCGTSGAASKTFNCDEDVQTHELYCAFSLDQPLDDVIGIEAVVDIQHSASTLPDWWQLGVGGCRQGELDANGLSPTGSCTDFWLEEATDHGIQGYTVGQPRGGANQARIKVALAVLPSAPRTLNANEVYFAARILIGSGRTTGAQACEDCFGAACLVLNSIIVRRLPGAPGGDVVVQSPGPGNGNFALWQSGGGELCGAVPTRRSSWGQIKAIYR